MPYPSSEADEKAPVAVTSTQRDAESVGYASRQKQIMIMAALYLALFLVTLDQNIISTAIPAITDEFHSLDDIGWYGGAYILTICSFQLMVGKVYKFYPAKPVFLVSCLLFELGSVVCGAAPNSNAFIVGRAIAGLGSAGIFGGMMVIMFHTVPLRERPVYQGLLGAVFGIASVIGPLVGGTLTDKVTWRWCFYINLPIGGLAIVIITMILHLPNQKVDAQGVGWMDKIKQLDPLGNFALLPGITCLVLALQWGGTEYSWKNARIIALLVISAVLGLVFVGIQVWKQEDATIPPRIVKQRSIAASLWFGFFIGAGSNVMIYYLPVWFQAIRGVSALKSGIMLLPLILSAVVCSLLSGVVISKVGYYTPFFILSSIFMPIGAGLLSTLTPSAGAAKWIGYQLLFGIGFGFGGQQMFNVVQTVLDESDIATGSAAVSFTRFLGTVVFLPAAQSLSLNSLVSKLTDLPGIGRDAIVNSGATNLKDLASGNDLQKLYVDYNTAVTYVFCMVAATSAATVFGSIFVEWRSLKTRANKQGEQTNKIDHESSESKATA